jgi:outer membrane protein TolC
MPVGRSSVVTVLAVALLCGRSSWAEPAEPAQPAGSDLEDVRLLDDIPNYVEMLVSQWSGNDLPPGVAGFVDDSTHYGRLRDLTQPEPLTLADCVALALANNTDLQIARLGPLGARAQVRRAQSIFDPALFADVSRDRSVRPAGSVLLGAATSVSSNLNVNAGFRKTLRTGGQLSASWRTNRLSSNSQFIGLRPQYTTDFVLSLNQPLLRDFGLYFTTLQVRIARTAARSTVKEYEAALSTTIRQVEEAYWALVQANENVSVQEQGLVLARELQRQNEGKFKVGAAPRTAVLEAEAEVARREANLIEGQNARIIARDALRAVLNARSADADALRIVEPRDTPQVEPYTIDLERSLATALQRRPELAAARLNVEGSGMQLKIAENQLLPRLNALGSVGTNGLSGDAVPQTITDPTNPDEPIEVMNRFGGPYEDSLNTAVDGRYYSYSAGITLEVPLGNAQARADYAQVRVNLEQARLGLRQLQESVTVEVKRAVTNLESDLKSIEATRIARELAEENLRNQQARYDVGLATTKDLLDFQDRLTQAKAAEVQALTTYNTDLAELRRVEGTLLEARNVVLLEPEQESTPLWARF